MALTTQAASRHTFTWSVGTAKTMPTKAYTMPRIITARTHSCRLDSLIRGLTQNQRREPAADDVGLVSERIAGSELGRNRREPESVGRSGLCGSEQLLRLRISVRQFLWRETATRQQGQADQNGDARHGVVERSGYRGGRCSRLLRPWCVYMEGHSDEHRHNQVRDRAQTERRQLSSIPSILPCKRGACH